MKKRNIKVVLVAIMLLAVLLLQGCSSETKYTKSWIKRNIDLSTDGKTILVEDDTADMISADTTGLFFMEYSKLGEDWTLGYDIGGYQMFYYNIGAEQTGYIDYAEEQQCISITGDISQSTFVEDKQIIEDLFDIDFKHSKLSRYDDSEDGLAVIVLTSKDRISVLFLDKEENVCRRLEVAKKDENGKISELFLAVPVDVDSLEIPEAVFEVENKSEMDGEEFVSLSSQFVVGALANSAFNQTLSN